MRCREPSVRSLAPTLPRGAACDLAFETVSRTVTDPRFAAERVEDEMPPPVSRVRNRRRDWCVDFGARLVTMTTFELWIAIASGEVGSTIRVWREGMECWARVIELPELACAIRLEDAGAGETGWEREAGEQAPTSSPPLTEAPRHEDPVTLVVLPSTPVRPRSRRALPRAARPVAAGAAVALLAIGVAAFASSRPANDAARKSEPAWSSAAQMVTSAVDGAEPEEHVGAPVARRGDPGQHRMRHGHHLDRRAGD